MRGSIVNLNYEGFWLWIRVLVDRGTAVGSRLIMDLLFGRAMIRKRDWFVSIMNYTLFVNWEIRIVGSGVVWISFGFEIFSSSHLGRFEGFYLKVLS